MLTLFWSGRTNRQIHFGVFTSEGIYKLIYNCILHLLCLHYYFITRKRRDIFIENLKHEGLTVGDGESGGMLDSF